MVYRVIGVMSGNSSEGLHILFAELTETGGKWNYEIITEEDLGYTGKWKEELQNAENILASEYQLLHTSFGRYIGERINHFIAQNKLEHRVHLIASQGYNAFHSPGEAGTAWLGHGAFIAAETRLPVVSDLSALDIAFGGHGSPLAAIAEKLLTAMESAKPFPNALVIAFAGILRWREEANMLSASTGASQDSIGGAVWLGTEL